MTLEEFLTALGYKGSPYFLRREDEQFGSEPNYGHIFRRGYDRSPVKSHRRWQVEGVYGVRTGSSPPAPFVPIIYVCTAQDDAAARDLHRLVWNQDVVPYVLVHTPQGVRVYAGFHYSASAKTEAERGVLFPLAAFSRVQAIIDLFHARAVDTGRLWQHPQLRVDSNQRVYHRLLSSLSPDLSHRART